MINTGKQLEVRDHLTKVGRSLSLTTRATKLLSAMCVCMVLLFAAASPASALPENFFGISSDAEHFWNSPSDWNVVGHSGANLFHMQLNWQDVDVHGGWTTSTGWKNTYDKYIGNAAKNGLTVIPYFFVQKTGARNYPVVNGPVWSEWLEFVRTAVQRYGYGGSFWAENPNIPYRPVRVWELWNEENRMENSPSGVINGALYADFFKASGQKIHEAQNAVRKAGEPNNTIVMVGGLYQNNESGGHPTWEAVGPFLKNAAGGNKNGFQFEALSLHPYALYGSEKVAGVVSNIGQARSALNEWGSPSTPIWITELGWPIKGNAPNVTEAEQSALLTESFNWIKGNYAANNIQFLAWFFYRDVNATSENWDNYCGLLNSNGEYRPAWFAYQVEAGAARWPLALHSDSLGGVVTSAPDISSWNPNRLDVFVRGAGVSLAHEFFELNTGGWGMWEDWKGSLASESGPGAVSWGPGRVDVVGRASSSSPSKVTHWYWNGALNFGDDLGGAITSDPDISSWGSGRLDVFARGQSGELTHRYYESSTGWGQSWENWGGSLAAGAGPGAVSWGPGRIDIVGRAPDGSVTHWFWNGSLNVGDNLGGNIKGDPDIASWGPGRLDVFARGMDDALYQKTFANGRWYDWERLGGNLESGPGAVSWGLNRIDVVAKVSGGIQHWWLSP